MIETIPNLPDGVLGLSAMGTVTADDYESTLIPAVQAATSGDTKARILFLLGDQFEGYAAEAAMDDARMGLHHWNDFEKIALVTDHTAYRALIKGFGFLMPGEVKLFAVADLEAAKEWVSA